MKVSHKNCWNMLVITLLVVMNKVLRILGTVNRIWKHHTKNCWNMLVITSLAVLNKVLRINLYKYHILSIDTGLLKHVIISLVVLNKISRILEIVSIIRKRFGEVKLLTKSIASIISMLPKRNSCLKSR